MVICETDALAAYQEFLPQMEIQFHYSPKLPEITFDAGSETFYIKRNQVETTVEKMIAPLSRDIRFGQNWYFTNFKDLATEITQKIIEKHAGEILELDGTLNLNKKIQEAEKDFAPSTRMNIKDAIKKYGLDTFTDEEAYYKRLDRFIHDQGKFGYFDIEGMILKDLDKHVPLTPQAKAFYEHVLKTEIGNTTVQGAIDTVLGKEASDITDRALGFGTNLFSYAMQVGLEHEVAQEFITRTKNMYESTYGVARDYFAKTDCPAAAHMKALQAVKNVKNMKRLLITQLPDEECLYQLRSATLQSCENLMQDPPSNNSRASPASPRGGSYSMII